VGFAPFCKDRPTQLETAGLQAGAAYGRCARMAQPYLVEGQPALDGCFLAVKRTVNRATPDLTVILIEGEERQGRAQLTATRFVLGRREALTSHRASAVNVAVNETPANPCSGLPCHMPTEQRKHRISASLHTRSND
jgi:hypothetical protein